MGKLFEQIDSQPSSIGEISLRRRRIPALGPEDIYEVKLGDEFLMSSLFVAAEEALADLGVDRLPPDQSSSVVVGGLGLGYTAAAALRHANVAEVLVVELLAPVIDWHERGLVPNGRRLTDDPRCRYQQGDFFACATSPEGFDRAQPGRQFDAILLDIDHSPSAWLDADNASFYTTDSLRAMAQHLRPGGVFGFWSNEPPDEAFSKLLQTVFTKVEAREVRFFNRFQNRDAVNTVYLGTRAAT